MSASPDHSSALAEALDEVLVLVKKYMHFVGDEQAVAFVLWIAHTYVLEQLTHSPRLFLRSYAPACGKTTALRLIEDLAHQALMLGAVSQSALFRYINSGPPKTLLLDEIDAVFGATGSKDEAIKNIINTGHSPDGAVMKSERTPGGSWKPVTFRTYGAVAMAGIGDLPWTTSSRSIIFTMEPPLPHESIQRYVGEAREVAKRVGQKLARALDGLELDSWPDFNSREITRRDQDNWCGMLLIAEAASDMWAVLAREAMKELCADDESRDVDPAMEVLLAVADHYRGHVVVSTDELIDWVRDDEQDWERVDPVTITPITLARMLKKFGVRPENVTVENGTKRRKGYRLHAIQGAVLRFMGNQRQQRRDD